MAEHNGYAGGVNPYDAATLSLFNTRGFGRGGYYGDEYLSAKAHANGTAENAKLDAIKDDVMSAARQNTELLRDRQFNDIQLNIQNVRTELVRQAGDNRVELQEEVGKLKTDICSLSKELLQCCCETQKEVIAQGTATRELVNSRALAEAEREIDRADRRANTQDIIAAVGHHHYGRAT